jgi:vacuolar-type H+-ATPase subunit H
MLLDITSAIDKLEDLIAEGKKVPLTQSVVVNEQKVYEIVDQIRANYPDELKHARWIVKEKEELLKQAEDEAAKIVSEAKEQAEQLAQDAEIVKLAESKAQKILDEAKAEERKIRLSAEDYADELLANVEAGLGKLLTAVQRNRDRLQGKSSESRVR